MFQVEHMHPKFLRLFLDLQEIQVKHLLNTFLEFCLFLIRHGVLFVGCCNFLAFCYINPSLPFLRVPAVCSLKAAHIVTLYYLLIYSL